MRCSRCGYGYADEERVDACECELYPPCPPCPHGVAFDELCEECEAGADADEWAASLGGEQ